MLEELVGQFRDVLQILQDEGVSERNRLPKIREALGDPAEALAQCNEHIAYAGQFDLPFMLVPYRTQRSLLFQCLDMLPLQSSACPSSESRYRQLTLCVTLIDLCAVPRYVESGQSRQ